MDEDLKDGVYRLIYIFTFVLVFCIIPLIYIIANTDLNRKEIRYECEDPKEVTEILQQKEPGEYDQFVYKLSDGSEYSSTIKYNIGDKVCRF